MAIQQSSLLQSAFNDWKPQDTSSIDYKEFAKGQEELSKTIDEANKTNWDKYVHFSKKQEDLLKNINLDLSTVRQQDRDAIRAFQTSQMDKFATLGIKDALQDVDIIQGNNKIAQDVAMSKQANEYVKLLKDQMSKESDFNTEANRKKIEAYENASLDELYNMPMPTIEPLAVIKFGDVFKEIYTKSAKETADIYIKGGLYSTSKLTQIDDDVAKANYDLWVSTGIDEYGNSVASAILEAYKDNHPSIKDPKQEDANSWMFEFFKKAKTPDVMSLSATKELRGEKADATQVRAEKVKEAIDKRVLEMRDKSTPLSDVNEEKIKIKTSLTESGINDIADIKAMKSVDAQTRKAIGAYGNQKVYQIVHTDGSVSYVAYGKKDTRDTEPSISQSVDEDGLRTSLYGNTITGIIASNSDKNSSGNPQNNRIMNYLAREKGFNYVPDDVTTLGRASDFAKQVNRAGSKSSAMGTYQITGQTMRDFAPKVFGENWRDVQFDDASQDALGKAIFENSKTVKGLMGRWAGLTESEAKVMVNQSWDEAKVVIAQKESGAEVLKHSTGDAKTSTTTDAAKTYPKTWTKGKGGKDEYYGNVENGMGGYKWKKGGLTTSTFEGEFKNRQPYNGIVVWKDGSTTAVVNGVQGDNKSAAKEAKKTTHKTSNGITFTVE